LNLISTDGAAQSELPTEIDGSIIYVVQGSNSFVSEPLNDDEFYTLRINTYTLPHDVSRVYTKVPSDAWELLVIASGKLVGEDSYGLEQAGEHEGEFYVDVPASHNRKLVYNTAFDEQEDFLAPEAILEDVSYLQGTLNLSENATSGNYTSPIISFNGSHTILTGNVTLFGTDLDNVSVLLSNDGGSNWTQFSNATEESFITNGTDLKFRLEFEGNISAGYDPRVTEVMIETEQTLLYTHFSLHVSYIWEQDFIDKSTIIELSEPHDYHENSSLALMLYVSQGYIAEGLDDLQLTHDPNVESSQEGKDLYLYMTDSHNGTALRMQITETSDWTAYILGAGIGIAIFALILIAYVKRGRRGAVEPSEEIEEEPEMPDDERRSQLIAHKKEIMSEMAALKKKRSSGDMDSEKTEEALSELKEEFKEVRRELQRLSRKEAKGERKAPAAEQLSSREYEKALATLAKLDEDYEKGKLPEDSYKQLRKKYLEKATELKEMLRSLTDEMAMELQKLEEEKEKLMEAIVSLEDELKEGEVEEEVSEELSASYRMELASVLKKIDEIKKK